MLLDLVLDIKYDIQYGVVTVRHKAGYYGITLRVTPYSICRGEIKRNLYSFRLSETDIK